MMTFYPPPRLKSAFHSLSSSAPAAIVWPLIHTNRESRCHTLNSRQHCGFYRKHASTLDFCSCLKHEVKLCQLVCIREKEHTCIKKNVKKFEIDSKYINEFTLFEILKIKIACEYRSDKINYWSLLSTKDKTFGGCRPLVSIMGTGIRSQETNFNVKKQ